MITAVDRAQTFADGLLLISNYPGKKKGEGEIQALGNMVSTIFPLSKVLSGQAEVAQVHRGPQRHLALILPCRPDVRIWLRNAPYGSTYSPGEENKWFVFVLWSHSLRTYESSF